MANAMPDLVAFLMGCLLTYFLVRQRDARPDHKPEEVNPEPAPFVWDEEGE